MSQLKLPQHFRLYCFLLVLFNVIQQSASFFCSAYCKPNFCTGKLPTQCTACSPPFILQPNNTCTVDPNSGYAFFQNQNQVVSTFGGTINCGIYVFDGTYVTSTIGLRSAAAITIPHYSVRLIAWVILYNQWDAVQDSFRGVLNTTGQQVTQPVSTYSTAEPLCSTTTLNEWYMKLQMEFAHNQLVNRIRVDLSNTNVLSKSWGIKEYMYIVGVCHTACQICNDATTQNCTSCTTGYFLSGTVCNESCLYRYGIVASNQTCVACSPFCTACYQLATNCSSCQTTGVNEAFLSGTTCAPTCPSRFTQSTSNQLCVPCTSSLCLICTQDSPGNCLSCQTGSYWLNFNCYATCPNGYYPLSPNCTACHPSCTTCTNSPSPCSACSSNFFLYASQCSSTCPPGYFGHVPSRTCLSCAGYCVTATAVMSLSIDNSTMVTKITFSRQIDFNTFSMQSIQSIVVSTPGFSIDSFSKSYQSIDSYSFSISLTPKTTINMSDVNFTLTVNPKTTDLFSVQGYPFDLSVYTVNSSILWSLIKLPQLSGIEKNIIQQLQLINTNINNVLNGASTQQIKKLGVFGYLFTGAQLCSLVVLHNSRPVQNFYEASRFWGSFIYFEVPKWEKDHTHTKYVGNKQVTDIVPSLQNSLQSQHQSRHRLLQLTNPSDNWRFTRTGHTQILLFDCYMIIALLTTSWLVLLVVKLCGSRLQINTRSMFHNALHKIHEVSLFFITLSVLLEWITLPTKQNQAQYQQSMPYVYASFGLSILAALYFLAYEVYIFYRLIPFGSVQAGSKKYKLYLERYSYFLRDLRFTQPTIEGLSWTYKQLVKPHNYQILSCIRLVLLVCTMPIFYSQPFAAITVLIIVQLLQTIRFIVTWPYHSALRNGVKLTLEIILLLIFATHMCTYLMMNVIYQNLNMTTQIYMKMYFMIGWVGFALVFVYNLGFIGYQIADVIAGCRWTNQQRMECSRKQHYYKMLDQFQQKILKEPVKQDNDASLIGLPKSGSLAVNSSTKQKGKNLSISIQIANKLYESFGSNSSALPANPALHALTMKSIIPEYDLLQPRPRLNQSMTPKPLPNKNRRKIEQMINKGNLINKQYGDLPTVYVTIEHYEITYTEKQYKYNVKIDTVPAVFMRPKISPESNHNLLIPQRTTKQVVLLKSVSHEYFFVIDEIFKTFGSVVTQSITIRTNLKVDQNLYKPCQQIPKLESTLSQWIQIKNHNGLALKQKLQFLLPGFPIPPEIIASL